MKPVLRLPWLLPRRRPATVRLRLTLLAILIAAVCSAPTAVGIAITTRTSMLQHAMDNSTSTDDLQLLAREEAGLLLKDGKLPDCGTASPQPRGHRRVSYCRAPMPGNPMLSEGTLSLTPWTDPVHGPAPIRTVSVYPGEFSYVAVMIYSLEAEQARLNSTVWALAAATLGITALIAGSTWIAAGRVLRPVEAIRAEFAELSTHHLDQRVTVPRTGNEIARLATTMNRTLDQLQTAVERQRQFTADASHELRTPLACLRTELELALNRPDDADWPRVVHAAHEDTIRVQELTEDLLLLARLDAEDGDRRPRRSVDLTDLVREETARRRPPRGLRLHVHAGPEPVTVQGQPALLARVIGNLLDNAERHATHTIDVRLTHDTHRREAVIDVLDDGPGVPVDDRQRIFERFTRLDDARARDTGGAGLGLAIAHHITTTHQGALDIVPSPRGAHFALRLPTPPP